MEDKLNLTETTIGGIIVALFGALIGMIFGNRGKVSKDEFDKICKERQTSCTQHICSEIQHVRESQKEMKEDQKEVKSGINDILLILKKDN